MEGQIHLNPKLVVERLQKAMNDRGVDAFVDCFDSLYYAEQPNHPGREPFAVERESARNGQPSSAAP